MPFQNLLYIQHSEIMCLHCIFKNLSKVENLFVLIYISTQILEFQYYQIILAISFRHQAYDVLVSSFEHA